MGVWLQGTVSQFQSQKLSVTELSQVLSLLNHGGIRLSLRIGKTDLLTHLITPFV
jgi:hypothetical protein